MNIAFQTLHLKKRFPLAISRGVRTGSDNLFISITQDGITGIGEMAPGSTEGANTPELGQQALEVFLRTSIDGLSPAQVYDRAREQDVPACALAALDIALWDLQAKTVNRPLFEHLNLGKPTVPTSVTIGINPPEVVKERVPLLLDGSSVKSLKIKLGSPEGIEADKAMYAQVVESTRGRNVQLRVDANGGWDVSEAQVMMKWIAERGADYIEQPLKEGAEEGLPTLYKNRALPIYLDESCRYSEDVGKWAHCVDGVNMKLMKCGGITEALRIIEQAKQHGLKTMIGCMGESSISISAAAALTGAIDHIDLDSHLNLAPDPCTGATLQEGIMMPNDLPGHGGAIKPEFSA